MRFFIFSYCWNKENILLDDGFRGILSDFGLSQLAGKEQSRVVTTVRGTVGYLAPEWLLGTGITEKSDVYSYGMVLLEMVSGRRCLRAEEDGRWSYLPKIPAELVREGRVMEVVDGRLVAGGKDQVEEAAVRRAVHVALWCAQEKAGARPSMTRVVEMLEGRWGRWRRRRHRARSWWIFWHSTATGTAAGHWACRRAPPGRRPCRRRC